MNIDSHIRTRWIAAPLAGASCSAAMLGAVILLFDQASQTDWLVATPGNVAALAPCGRLAGPARDRCVERTVAAIKDSADRQTLALDQARSAATAR